MSTKVQNKLVIFFLSVVFIHYYYCQKMQICLANLCFLFTFASRKVTKTVYSVFGTCINKIKKQKWTITRRIILIRKAGERWQGC